MIKLLEKVFAPRQEAPAFRGQEFPQLASQMLDPYRPLEPGEDGCTKANTCVVLDVAGYSASQLKGRQIGVSDGRKLLLSAPESEIIEVIPLVCRRRG